MPVSSRPATTAARDGAGVSEMAAGHRRNDAPQYGVGLPFIQRRLRPVQAAARSATARRRCGRWSAAPALAVSAAGAISRLHCKHWR